MPNEDIRPIKVEVKNLTKKFGDLLVLDDMSFHIRKFFRLESMMG